MRWFILLVIIGCILWAANAGYHYLDDVVLITNMWVDDNPTWEAASPSYYWRLAHFQSEEPTFYAYIGRKGFWNIFKELWPIWTMNILSVVSLIPLLTYIYNNQKKAQEDAEEKARHAYEVKLSQAKKELEKEWHEYHRLKNDIVEKESNLRRKERAAQEQEALAKQSVIKIQKQYQQEKALFDKAIQENTKAKMNAQSGQKRLRKEKQQITHFLEKEGWTIDDTPLTYEKLKALAKAKHP